MNVSYHRQVAQDLEGAIEYYEAQAPGLGLRFLAEFESTIEKIVAHPERFPFLKGDKRRCLFRNFPYVIAYREDVSGIRVLVVKHHKRHPDHGMSRI